ncbi:MAG: hypothetical protein ACI4S3_09410 [Candidatus Gastranaerophilaceae bacterium]
MKLSQLTTLNKNVFVQRNIIKSEENLPKFIDKIFDKIYKYDFNQQEKNKAKNYVLEGKIALGTSLYTNLLQQQKPMGACTVLSHNLRENISKQVLNGVGVGFDLSKTSKPTETLISLNDLLMSMDKKTQRPPAGIALLDIYHKNIEEFINLKRNTNFSNWRFNISVSVPETFLHQLDKNENITLSNGKKVPAQKIYNNIVGSMHYCGEPGILFRDRVEASNPLPTHPYKGMASCAEIALENGEMCLFSHINLPAFLDKKTKKIDYDSLGDATKSLSRLLDNVININLKERINPDNVSALKRRFGIGVCGLADVLAEMNIPYGSKNAQKVIANCLETINFASKQSSMQLAKERGAFPLFLESKYNDFNFLMKHKEGSPVTKENWFDLYKDVQKYGLRNATTTALPPTGSSSRIVGSSYSIEPYFDLRGNKIFDKKISELGLDENKHNEIMDNVKMTGSCQNIAYIPEHLKKVFRVGNEITYQEHLGTVGTAQKFIDDGISKTINLPNKADVSVVDKIIKMAHSLKLKGITIFRDKSLEERNIQA